MRKKSAYSVLVRIHEEKLSFRGPMPRKKNNIEADLKHRIGWRRMDLCDSRERDKLRVLVYTVSTLEFHEMLIIF